MARFSADADGAGPSGPNRKKQRIIFASDSDEELLETETVKQEEVGHDDDYDEEEESSSSEEEEEEDDEEQEQEQEVNENSNTQIAAIVEPMLRSSNPSVAVGVGPPTRTTGAICVTLTDPEVLDCPICYESFSIPVFQCENGHTACSSCCKKVANKCPSCALPIGYNRCRAVEKVLESVKVPCHNLKYGCKEIVSYSKKFEHDKICNNAPCSCPLSGCNFVGSSIRLYQHYSRKHKGSAALFRYNTTFPVFFTVNDKSLILQEEKEGVLFVLHNTSEVLGNVITVNCIRPPSSEGGYFYELTARMEKSTLRFQYFTKNIQKVNQDDPHSDTYLVVPGGFFGSYEQISLDLCIWRYGMYPPGIGASTLRIPQRGSNTNVRNTSIA